MSVKSRLKNGYEVTNPQCLGVTITIYEESS